MTFSQACLLATLALALVLPGRTVRAEASGAVTLTLADGKADPAQLAVPAGVTFTLIVRNTGQSPAEFESKRLHIEKVVAPGAELTLPLTLPAGAYPFVDDFHTGAKGVIAAK
jgi:hypothetical protein